MSWKQIADNAEQVLRDQAQRARDNGDKDPSDFGRSAGGDRKQGKDRTR